MEITIFQISLGAGTPLWAWCLFLAWVILVVAAWAAIAVYAGNTVKLLKQKVSDVAMVLIIIALVVLLVCTIGLGALLLAWVLRKVFLEWFKRSGIRPGTPTPFSPRRNWCFLFIIDSYNLSILFWQNTLKVLRHRARRSIWKSTYFGFCHFWSNFSQFFCSTICLCGLGAWRWPLSLHPLQYGWLLPFIASIAQWWWRRNFQTYRTMKLLSSSPYSLPLWRA